MGAQMDRLTDAERAYVEAKAEHWRSFQRTYDAEEAIRVERNALYCVKGDRAANARHAAANRRLRILDNMGHALVYPPKGS